MINIGDLVNNIECDDYNLGMVLDNNVNMAFEINQIYNGPEEDFSSPPFACEPRGVRVLWESGEINIHYTDALEVINDIRKQRVD